MIKLGNHIRLTAQEQALFRHHTGAQVVPASVDQYNRYLQDAAACHRQEAITAESEEDAAACELLARLIELDQA
ncbi:MAG: hypothetical protein HY847_02395 [Betaproteobacteria bacterium]|nr:hypothetical protein [Betaproteobacteria bacterium]